MYDMELLRACRWSPYHRPLGDVAGLSATRGDLNRPCRVRLTLAEICLELEGYLILHISHIAPPEVAPYSFFHPNSLARARAL